MYSEPEREPTGLGEETSLWAGIGTWMGVNLRFETGSGWMVRKSQTGANGNMDMGLSAWGRVGELAVAKSAKYPRFVVQIDERF